jgi:peptidyl-prolyl cis-trans isomerase D
VFAAAPPAAGKVTPGMKVLPDGAVMLFTVDRVVPGDAAQLPPGQREMLQQQVAQLRAASEVQALVGALRKKYRVTVVETSL